MPTHHRLSPLILARARELRQPQTASEARLWMALRNRNFGFKFRRQHPIDRFIVDFYCAQARLCIEIDGDSHNEPGQAAYDAARTQYLQERGDEVIRFSNADVQSRLEAVLEQIVRAARERIAGKLPLP